MGRRLTTVVLLAAMAASACASGSTAGTETAGPVGSEDPAADATQNGAVAQGATAMAASSPIGAFFADDGGFEAAIAEYRVQVREAIRVCMAEQGFDFAVVDITNRNPIQARQNELTEREWTKQYGFGISTSFESFAASQAENPNVAIFQSLAPAEQESWAFTLNGQGVAGLGGGGNQISNSRPLEDQGCIGQSLIDTGGQEAVEGLGDFGDTYDEGEAALFERREMIEVVDAWSRCMGEGGFANFAALDDPEDDVRKQFQAVTAPIAAARDALTDEEGQALLSGDAFDIEKVPGLDIEALREVQDYERNLALADLDCYEADVKATYEPLRDEFENGLLEEFATEFAAVKNLGS